jgi:hypothetical protein
MLPIYRELIAAGIRIWVFRYVEFLSRTWFLAPIWNARIFSFFQ